MAGEVPIWWWRMKSAPYGARLPKRTIRAPKEWPKETRNVIPVSILGARIGRRLDKANNRARKPGSIAGFAGNLNPEEYQYFWGMRNSSSCAYQWSMCKICRKTFQKPEERKAHAKKKPGERLTCAQKAIIVCNLLAKDKACVACNGKTGHFKWGVPLCDTEECLSKFMFQENWNEIWLQGVKFAEKLNWPKGKRQ